MTTTGGATIRYLSKPDAYRVRLRRDALSGLTASPKRLPSTYFYDAVGSELFEEITKVPEYYLTRAETEILDRYADEILGACEPDELIELGSGSSRKTRLLLDAMRRLGCGVRYVPVDISEAALREAHLAIRDDYGWLEMECLIGDFSKDLHLIPRHGRRLVAFLGSTIGNLERPDRVELYTEVASMLDADDRFLLGVDLVKDEAAMVAAYDDAAGVTAAFNRNILTVLNRELDGNIPVEAFEHVTSFDATTECMRQRLRATREVDATLAAIDLDVHFDTGEELYTERSCKFTREGLAAELVEAGLEIVGWWTDAENRFALVGIRKAP
jgi:L-histidine N-alpha-methyltransferase